MLSNPADLGYDGSISDLPPLNIHEILVDKTGYIVKEAQTLIEKAKTKITVIEQANQTIEDGKEEKEVMGFARVVYYSSVCGCNSCLTDR